MTLSLVASLACTPFARAQSQLRVEVSTRGHAVLDSLLDAIADRSGLAGQLVVSHVEPIAALRDFCRNEAGVSPDVVLVTHRMRAALEAECAKNGADNVADVELARDPLILAVRYGSVLTSVTSRQVYLAIAREVPFREGFTRNTAVRWSDVDAALPAQDIRFQLPMRDEGGRGIFDTFVLQAGCRNEASVKQIFDAHKRTMQCITTRSDRVREMPRAQAMKLLLEAPVGTVGVLSQHELTEAKAQFTALTLDGKSPTPEAIKSGSYDFSTSFWLYAKRSGASDPMSLAIARLIAEAQSDVVIGPDGPLTALGLVPLPAEERAAQRLALATVGKPYGLGSVVEWIEETAADAWIMFGVRSSQSVTAAAEAPMDFDNLMDIAGYQIANVQSTIGIIPGASMSFGLAREMSDADRDYLQRILRRDALARPGLLAAVQRKIISSIMGVEEVGGFQVSKVEIDFLPLPSASLEVTPKGAGGMSQPDSSSSESE